MAGIIVTQSLVGGQTFATAVNKGPTVVTPAVIQVQLFDFMTHRHDRSGDVLA